MSRDHSRFFFLFVAGALTGCSERDTFMAPTGDPASQIGVASATIIVTNTDDAGPGSLRQAIADAQDGDEIHFDPVLAGQTIMLTSQRLYITKSVTIEGPVAGGVTVNGSGLASASVLLVSGDANPAILRNLTITGGVAGGIDIGPAEFLDPDVELILDRVTVSGNTAAWGGGIKLYAYSKLTLLASTVSGNTATFSGGGIWADGGVTLINSTISGNTSQEGGAAIHGDAPDYGSILLINSTIAGNVSAAGAAIHQETDIRLHNTIVANPVANCFGSFSFPAPAMEGVNLVSDETCGSASPTVIVADPMLGPLAGNGGPTMTHALLEGSPAIDAAADCVVTEDQRGIDRPRGAACDIGAFEFTDFPILALALEASGTVNPNTGVATVTGTLTCTSPASVPLQVDLVQEQKGRVKPIVEASGVSIVECYDSHAWSIELTPSTGGFQNGAANVSARTLPVTPWLEPAAAARSIRLFWGPKR
jgi:predicted outer membrane repeat protein